MKFSENWLRELADIPVGRDELIHRLTMAGLEVEEAELRGEGLDDIVVAEITACAPHPDADRLQVCQVNDGSTTLEIVCGAPNARPGIRVPLAPVGATLPGGLNIKVAKLRGVTSNGMLCSAKELQLEDDATGLMELPADAPIGAKLVDYLQLPDACLELKLTPNRADCLSLSGLAYDLAALFGGEPKPVSTPAIQAVQHDELGIELDAGADCPRYCGRIIHGIDPQARSPLWLKERLRRAGLRPISLLVDITNFVMLELGQPMHAFDLATLSGPVGVRRGKVGETVRLLDERNVDVDEDVLLIVDAKGPVALAGVMGGFDTRVTDATRSVFLESAHFAPAAIAGRARRYGLHTDASHRFERGVDPELPRRAIERATALILEISGGQAGPVTEAQLADCLPHPQPVRLRRQRLARVLGLSVPDAEVERILKALGMNVASTDEGWTVTAPTRRFDIEREEDLIEEVVRVHGYDKVPTHAPSGELRLAPLPEGEVPASRFRHQMTSRDYLEALNYAFLAEGTLAAWQFPETAVKLANPLTEDLGVMRSALVPSLVETLKRNHARQQSRIRLFEIGHVFAVGDAAPVETSRIAAVCCGPARTEQWSDKARAVDFHDLRGDLESLAALSQATLAFEPLTDCAWLHPGRAASVLRDGVPIGWIGQLHPALQQRLDLDIDVLAFELDLPALQRREVPRARPVSRYPSVRRDLAVIVPETTPWAALEASLHAALGEGLREVRLFDQFVGGSLESGFKSLAMGLILQDVSRTLTDSDADAAVSNALTALMRDCAARLRG
ncbi:MAG: phenylalanine--tRNA ligase subunit beta [Lysobacteraceae bacterium]